MEFIWDHEANEWKIHIIDWSKICKPKEVGGLGFRELQGMNNTCLMKLIWKEMSRGQDLWILILESKYKRSRDWPLSVLVKDNDYYLWKSLANLWQLVVQHIGKLV